MGDHRNRNGNLPPGFRFYPTDEELIVHFLNRKASLLPCHPDVIPDLDLFPYDPWDLEGKALVEGSKWYYYSRKTRNRVTENGCWKPIMGLADDPIFSSSTGKKVGIKKYYSFQIGISTATDTDTAGGADDDDDEEEEDDGDDSSSSCWTTNWVMHEYRLVGQFSTRSSGAASSSTRRSRSSKSVTDRSRWVICKVFEQAAGGPGGGDNGDDDGDGNELSCLDEVFLSMDDYDDISYPF